MPRSVQRNWGWDRAWNAVGIKSVYREEKERRDKEGVKEWTGTDHRHAGLCGWCVYACMHLCVHACYAHVHEWVCVWVCAHCTCMWRPWVWFLRSHLLAFETGPLNWLEAHWIRLVWLAMAPQGTYLSFILQHWDYRIMLLYLDSWVNSGDWTQVLLPSWEMLSWQS